MPGRKRRRVDLVLCFHVSSVHTSITLRAISSPSSSSRPYFGALFFAQLCSFSYPSQLFLKASNNSLIVARSESNTKYLMASSESTVVAKVTPSMVVKLSSAPPCVMSKAFSAQPRTRQDR